MAEPAGPSAWAKLRQVVIATTSHADDVAAARRAFGLGASFDDPELKTFGLADATFPISAERFLEFVGPASEHGPLTPWLTTIGGRGGYVLSVQHPDPAGVRRRCTELGVRVPIETEAFGQTVLQLHAKDVGLVLEIDGIADRAAWFWDAISPGPDASAGVDEIVGVDVPVADPTAMTALWHEVLGLGEPTAADVVELDGAWVRFVPGGPSSAWVVVMHRSNDTAVDPGLPGISFRFV